MTDPWFGGQSAAPIRVRFTPSPVTHLHVGDVRTALYNWAFARHTGGAFVLSVEDTEADQATAEQATAEQAAAIQETLHWLGLNWDEGPDQGGSYGPYRQSERIGLYHQWAQRLLDTGHAYWCYCTPEELQARHEAAEAPGAAGTQGTAGAQETLETPGTAGTPGAAATQGADYDRYCRTVPPDQVQAYLAEGRRPVLRFLMPDGSTTFTDLIRGEITVDHHDVPDFVLMRAGGNPLETLAAAVDDVMMRITHVIRGEELLPAAPRQLALYRAMGLPDEQLPVFGHLPQILGDDGQKLSRRNGVTAIDWYRQEGFLPEALDNYLAGLNWPPGEDRDESTLDDLVGGFELSDVSPSAARFDPEKLEALNGAKIRGLTPADFARRIVPFLARTGLVTEPLSSDQMWFIRDGAPLIQDRITRLTEVPALLAFLLVPESGFRVPAEEAAAVLTADAATPLKAAAEALAPLSGEDWTAPAIEAALHAALVDGLGLEPGVPSEPVQVAITGRRNSPPLPESMALLGRDRSLARLAAAQAASGTSVRGPG
ncbi:MAG TPA: glutamate--tRNA ligase family protein [Streptosporangiaceae bacterium]